MCDQQGTLDDLSIEKQRRELVRSLLRRLPSPTDWGDDLPEALRLMLTISIKAELYIREWLQPKYREFPWTAISCALRFEDAHGSLDRSPRIALTAMVDNGEGYKEPMVVPYTTKVGDKSGMMIGAIFAGDRVLLKSFPGVKFVVHEMRPDKNLVLVSTVDTPINKSRDDIDPRWKVVGPVRGSVCSSVAKSSSETKSLGKAPSLTQNATAFAPRVYKELHPIHFLGCIVQREARIGTLNNVYNCWSVNKDLVPDDAEKLKFSSLHEILFSMPTVDILLATKALKNLAKKRINLLALSSTPSAPDTNRGRDVLLRSSQERQRSMKAGASNDGDRPDSPFGAAQRKGTTDPILSMQRRKHVEQWAVRKAEIAAATGYLSKIDHFPSAESLMGAVVTTTDNVHSDERQRERYQLQLEKTARKTLWLGIGRALRALARGNADAQGVLLNAWRVWSQFHDREIIANAKSSAQSPLAKLDLLESSCVAAWYSQRLRTNCDARELVKARTMIRKRLHQLREQGVEATLGQIFGSDGSLHPENWSDDVCRSIVESAVVGGFLDIKRTELRFLDCKKGENGEDGYYSANSEGLINEDSLCVVVPCANYVVRKLLEYEYPWLRPRAANSGSGCPSGDVEDDAELEELSDTSARIAPGDVLYLAMGRDDTATHASRMRSLEDDAKTTSISIPETTNEGIMKSVPFKWCEVLAVDVLFARILLRPLDRPAPECWLHRAELFEGREQNEGGRTPPPASSARRSRGPHNKTAGVHPSSPVGLWVPVSLLWDAVVFSPRRVSVRCKEQEMGGEEDVMHTTITRNGMQYVECRYSVFTVPALSSASALAYLQHLAETIPVHVLAPGDGRGRGRMDV